MSASGQELEAKLYISNLPALKAQLQTLEARLVQPRTHEINLRFDTPDGLLRRSLQVLRLRQDTLARLTYKGPAKTVGGAQLRREIEFSVSDFEAARALLETLGYQVSLVYEKRRATYELEGVQVTLDELPFGDFVEVEGPHAQGIQAVVAKLGIDWEARIPHSYTELFERLRQALGLGFRDLTFENFAGLVVSPEDLRVRPADEN
jgi:adenylate cyclase, class 2